MATDTRRNAAESFDLQGNIPLKTESSPIMNVDPHPLDMAYLEWVYNQDMAYAEQIVEYREYYDGDNESMLTDRQREYLQVNTDIEFRINGMAIPVDIQSERLRVIGFDVVGEDSETNPQAGDAGILWEWWQRNRLDGGQLPLHKAAARDGDTFAIVGWDAETKQPTIHHEQAWDGSSGVIMRYRSDDRTRPAFAIKRWVVESGGDAGKVAYMTVYTPGAIGNYVGTSGGRSWRELPDDAGVWPIPWVNPSTGEPLGIPVFHCDNNSDGTGYGLSELHNLIGPQNALDKSVLDELAVADGAGFPVRYAFGITVPDGTVIGPATFLSTNEADGNMGQLPAADVSAVSALVEKWITRIAQLSRTPLSFFQITGQVASADTQKAGDSPLVSKVRSRATGYGNFWEDVFYMCRKLHNTFAGGVVYDELIISTVWDSFESVDVAADERTTAETAQIKADTFAVLLADNPNADRAGLARLAGYNEDDAQVLATPSTGFIDDGLTQ